MEDINPQDVLNFWQSVGPDGWWKKDETLDTEITNRFSNLHEQISTGQKENWLETPNGALASIIVLDQFSRNMFRGSNRAFAQDTQALMISKQGIEKGFDAKIEGELRIFYYLPFEHSENIREQEISVKLQYAIGDSPEAMKAALEHREIISRFGRFPHRNVVLGRHTTPAEQAYLDGGGFKG